jgi:hypothetical protein
MNITSLIDVINSETPVNKIYTSPIERFTDNDNILSDRIFAFSLLESHEQLEFISDLCSVYQFTKTDNTTKLLKGLCSHPDIDITIKNIILTVFDDDTELKLKILETSENKFNLIVFFDIFKRLIDDKIYLNFTLRINNIIDYVSSRNKTEEYYYKIYKNIVYFKDKKCAIQFYKMLFFNSNEHTKILCADALKAHINEEELVKGIIDLCETIESNDRLLADAADLLLRWGINADKYFKKLTGLNPQETIFENRENAHIFSSDKNIEKFINFLSNITLTKIEEADLFIKYSEHYKSKSSKIDIALSRIYIDQATYKGYSLLTIFLKMCKSIDQNMHKKELEKRLIEELEEMSGTCSSGHIIRLANVFNGFELELNVSVEEEFRYKFKHIIMKEIQQDEELIVDGIDGEKLSLFLMKNVDKVFNILWEEYEGQMIKTEFEDLFRKEYMKYEQLN